MVTVSQEKMASGILYKVFGSNFKKIQSPSAYNIWLSSRQFLWAERKIIVAIITWTNTRLTKWGWGMVFAFKNTVLWESCSDTSKIYTNYFHKLYHYFFLTVTLKKRPYIPWRNNFLRKQGEAFFSQTIVRTVTTCMGIAPLFCIMPKASILHQQN